MKKIFISYRRADSASDAGRLYDRLRDQVGKGNVFMDVDDIRPGEDYMVAIERRIARCDTLIVLIGPGWLSAADDHGHRRLDDPNDLARLEIETALKRDVSVVPILVGGAAMPEVSELPESLQALTRRHAVKLSHANFHSDVDSLIERLGGKPKPTRRRRGWLAGAVGAAAVILLLGYLASLDGEEPYDPPLGPPGQNLVPQPPPGDDETAPPSATAPAVNLTDAWYDNQGILYQMQHSGSAVRGVAQNPLNGIAMGELQGSFDGATLVYDYVLINGQRGSGRATLEPDGQHMGIVVTDAFGSTTTDRLHRGHLPQ